MCSRDAETANEARTPDNPSGCFTASTATSPANSVSQSTLPANAGSVARSIPIIRRAVHHQLLVHLISYTPQQCLRCMLSRSPAPQHLRDADPESRPRLPYRPLRMKTCVLKCLFPPMLRCFCLAQRQLG